jgi:hypothetical protein
MGALTIPGNHPTLTRLFLVVARQAIPTVDEDRKEQRLKILSDLNAENEKILSQYRWIDKSKGIVGIPKSLWS